MALTFSSVAQTVVGNLRLTVTDVTMDDSYLSGGETVAASSLGLTRVLFATCNIKSTSGGAVNVSSAYLEPAADPSANLLHVWNETPAEVSSTNDIATTVVRVLAYGT